MAVSIENFSTAERRLHLLFIVSLWAKAAFAFSEIVGGIAAFLVTKPVLVTAALWVTRNEFSEDPNDIIANYLLHTVQTLSIGSQEFAAIYLLVHGAIKLWLIIGLLRKKIWYYPTALFVFGLFILYQLYRFAFTHSLVLLFITLVDVVVIGLTWHEWKFLSRHPTLSQAE